MENFDIVAMPTIVAVCYLVGLVVKATALDNKWIPIIVGVTGGILGLLGFFVVPEFPAADFLTAAAVGVTSGLAATGVDQAVKQVKES